MPLAQCLAHLLSDNCYCSCLLLALFPPPFHSCPQLLLKLPPHGLHETDPHLTWDVSLPFPPVSVQVVSMSNASQTVTLVYMVGNQTPSSMAQWLAASSTSSQLIAGRWGSTSPTHCSPSLNVSMYPSCRDSAIFSRALSV